MIGRQRLTPGRPRSTGSAPAMVAGMWYVLAPVGIVLLILMLLLLYWTGADRTPADAVEPTTGTHEEQTPGGGQPDPRYDRPEQEREDRGGRPERVTSQKSQVTQRGPQAEHLDVAFVRREQPLEDLDVDGPTSP